MSDPYIDALHARLQTAAAPAEPHPVEPQHTSAMAQWWDEFVDVLGQKVGAWNERQAPRPPVNFTRRTDSTAHVWHRSAEVILTRELDAIRVSTRLGAEPARDALLRTQMTADGNVVAIADGDALHSPTAAAEYVLTPVLVETFANP